MKVESIYGIRAILEAINKGINISKILVDKKKHNPNIKEIIELCKTQQIPIQFVPEEKLFQFKNKNHQGIVAFISPIEYQSLENIIADTYQQGKMPLIVVLDGITDVRNFGAIARTTLSAGAHAIVIEQKRHAQINDIAIKTSAGALLKIPVCRETSLTHTIQTMKLHGLKIIACTEKATQNIYQLNLNAPIALILGNEEKGIRPTLLQKADHLASIPMLGNISSLNVSVAAGIVLYECIRQRMFNI